MSYLQRLPLRFCTYFSIQSLMIIASIPPKRTKLSLLKNQKSQISWQLLRVVMKQYITSLQNNLSKFLMNNSLTSSIIKNGHNLLPNYFQIMPIGKLQVHNGQITVDELKSLSREFDLESIHSIKVFFSPVLRMR